MVDQINDDVTKHSVLCYDIEKDIYTNQFGHVVNIQKKNKRHADNIDGYSASANKKQPLSLESMHLSLSSVVQIIAVCIAIVTQYNILENKLTAISNSLDDKDLAIKQLQLDNKQLLSRVELNESIINNMQYRLANLKK